jgi:hypothetical protein
MFAGLQQHTHPPKMSEGSVADPLDLTALDTDSLLAALAAVQKVRVYPFPLTFPPRTPASALQSS